MTGAFTLAGWHFSRNPTSSSSEQKVSMAEGSEPWNTGASGKYQYHPGGDKSRRRDAPSALNEVVIPNVNLPKVCLFSLSLVPAGFTDAGCRACTKSTTSMARRGTRFGVTGLEMVAYIDSGRGRQQIPEEQFQSTTISSQMARFMRAVQIVRW